MKFLTVYLDQNVLSELRVSRIKTNDFKFVKLFTVLKLPDYQLVYSEYNLVEINKIKNKNFVAEHLDALNILHGIYWHPRSKDESPNSKVVYKEYFEEKNSSFSQRLEDKHKKFIQSINGINTGTTVHENFNSLIDEVVVTSFSTLSSKISILKKPINKLSERSSKYLTSKLNPFNELEHESISNLIPELQTIVNDSRLNDIESYPPTEVLKEIVGRLVDYDPHFLTLLSYDEYNIENKIEFMFLLLNWVGYYPDKFQNITNKKGFHEASMLDARHAGVAWHFDYIISSDERFRKKCEACYHFISAEAQVVSVEEFLSTFSSRP